MICGGVDIIESQCGVWLGIERLTPFLEGLHTAADIDEGESKGNIKYAQEVVWLLMPGDRDGLVTSRSVQIEVKPNHQYTEEDLPELTVKVYTSKTSNPRWKSHPDETDDGSPKTSPASECDFIREFTWPLTADFVQNMLSTPYKPDSQTPVEYDLTQVRPLHFHFIMHRHGSGIRCGIIYRPDGNYQPFRDMCNHNDAIVRSATFSCTPWLSEPHNHNLVLGSHNG
jgi:hypothetical protein